MADMSLSGYEQKRVWLGDGYGKLRTSLAQSVSRIPQMAAPSPSPTCGTRERWMFSLHISAVPY